MSIDTPLMTILIISIVLTALTRKSFVGSLFGAAGITSAIYAVINLFNSNFLIAIVLYFTAYFLNTIADEVFRVYN